MDKVDLSNSPDLTMEQITKQLFNNELMSDVQFHVEGKVLYAHSWELMKRSIVFREQFRGTLGVNKLISIMDTPYDVVYEFLRFIYTDECDEGLIEEKMICDMLKLAARYKVVKLETKVMGLYTNLITDLQLFEYCLVNNYELLHYHAFCTVISELSDLAEEDEFLNIKPIVMEEILKSQILPPEMTEVKLFNVLVRWMERSCETNQIPIKQRRSHFNKLVRQIRFPIMTSDEFNLCVANHPDLFTSDDMSTICKQIMLKERCKNPKWRAEPRLKYVESWTEVKSTIDAKWETKFTVADNIILHGLRIGRVRNDFRIHISGTDRSTKATEVLTFTFESMTYWNIINLGESLKLKPNIDYTIEVEYNYEEDGNEEEEEEDNEEEEEEDYDDDEENDEEETDEEDVGDEDDDEDEDDEDDIVVCRKPNVNVVVTGPSELVTFTEVSGNIFEIIFKSPTN